MTMLTMRSVVSALLLLAVSSSIAADLDAGVAAYSRHDFEKALSEWLPLAEQEDNASAQYKLGVMYEHNKVDKPDDHEAEAVKWYRMAADNGHAEAQYNLGIMYFEGRGVGEEDAARAVYWWHKAAEKGHTGAQNNVGSIYERGMKLDKLAYDAMAVYWYRKAAEKGNELAQYRLGVMYEHNKVDYEHNKVDEPDVHEAKAVKWYRKAAKKGYAEAQYNLGGMYADGKGVDEQDDRLAVYWWHKAADQGHAEAQYNLGVRYENGEGVPDKDDRLAVFWFQRAALQGHAEAQYNLGVKHENGEGVPVEDIKAHAWAWFKLASDQGIEQAKQDLDLIEQRMTKAQTDKGRKLSNQLDARIEERREMVADTSPPLYKGKSIARIAGSGFLVSSNGEIVTNDHVVFGCDIVVVNRAGASYSAKLRARNFDLDLALLETWPDIGEPATFSESRHASLGEAVMVAGYPLRGSLPQDLNVTSGIVSKLSGTDHVSWLDLLQITAPTQSGNSGGPLLDDAGNVIGVIVGTYDSKIDVLLKDERMIMFDDGTTAIRTDAVLPQNVNFAIKGILVRNFLKTNGVAFSSRPSSMKLTTERLADMAHDFTVSVQASGHRDRCGNDNYRRAASRE